MTPETFSLSKTALITAEVEGAPCLSHLFEAVKSLVDAKVPGNAKIRAVTWYSTSEKTTVTVEIDD